MTRSPISFWIPNFIRTVLKFQQLGCWKIRMQWRQIFFCRFSLRSITEQKTFKFDPQKKHMEHCVVKTAASAQPSCEEWLRRAVRRRRRARQGTPPGRGRGRGQATVTPPRPHQWACWRRYCSEIAAVRDYAAHSVAAGPSCKCDHHDNSCTQHHPDWIIKLEPN